MSMSQVHAPTIAVVIPALNEEESLPLVLRDIPSIVDRVVVGDNGSTDNTAAVAREAGAQVVLAPQRGYGAACLAALAQLSNSPPDIVVFLDGDYSDHPEELLNIVTPILQNTADLVIGSRIIGNHEEGALLPQAVFGNWLSTKLISLFWGVHFTDLGPFRAIRWSSLELLNMQDTNYGWTVEMQVKAARFGLRCTEVPVSYRKRIGVSKVTGTVKGSVLAGIKILAVIFSHVFKRRLPHHG